MYQIDNSTAVAVIPASTTPGTSGFFTDGNPAIGVPATILPAEYMNMLMMEMLNVLSAAGVTPSKSTFTQLITAIRTVNKQSTVLVDTGTAGVYKAVNIPALTVLPATGFVQTVRIVNANPGAATYAPDGLAAKPIYGLGLQPLQGGELPPGIAVFMYLVQAGVNGGNGAWILLDSLGGALPVAPATQSQHAMQLGQATGRLIGVQVFSTAGTFTYTPTPGTNSVVVEVQGGGGAGGGAAATVAGAMSIGSGGTAGAYGISRLTSGFSGQTVTVGAAGVPISGTNGGAGGSSSFGSLVIAPGGSGGQRFGPTTPGTAGGGSASGSTASGGNIRNVAGAPGGICISISASIQFGGLGSSSFFGGGGTITATGSAPGAASSAGSGGAGASQTASSAALAGGAGAAGLVIVWEYA